MRHPDRNAHLISDTHTASLTSAILERRASTNRARSDQLRRRASAVRAA